MCKKNSHDLRENVCFDCFNAASIIFSVKDIYGNEIEKPIGLSSSFCKLQAILKIYFKKLN